MRPTSFRILRPRSYLAWVGSLLAVVPWVASGACVVDRPLVERPATLGQELIDLKEARDAGRLTEEEYEAQRTLALERFRAIDQEGISDAKSTSK